jgi:hypothetical protein
MRFSRAQWLPFLLVLFLAECHQRTIQDSREVFNLENFIDNQVSLLSEDGLELIKQVIINDSLESLRLIPDSLAWEKELSIFKTADIHKPGLRDFYTKTITDTNGSEVEEYTLKDTAKSETLFLKIKRDRNSDLIQSIEAAQQANNPIYRSRRHLYLQFEHKDHDKIRLDSFGVRGFQKMILEDTLSYFTAGKIIRPDEAE